MNPNTLSLIRAVPALGALLLAVPVWAAFVIDNVNGTVFDDQAVLTWDRCSWNQTGTDCNGGSASTHTWQDALNVAVEASGAGYKCYNDWRVPSLTELQSLVDTNFFPTIDPIAFPNTPPLITGPRRSMSLPRRSSPGASTSSMAAPTATSRSTTTSLCAWCVADSHLTLSPSPPRSIRVGVAR